jgi:hypothetical protein
MGTLDKLNKMGACKEAVEWAAQFSSIEDVIANCHRGDWMLWLAQKLAVHKQLRVLAAGRCAATVKHLMKDERSLEALEACEKYGLGLIGDGELAAAAVYAANAAAAVYAANAAAAVYAADAAAADAASSRPENQKQTADICREVLGEALIKSFNAWRSKC